MQARPLDSAVCQTRGYLPIFRPRLANTYDITMISATKRARPSSAGNSGIPEEVPEVVDEVDDAAVVCEVVGVVDVVEKVDEVVVVVDVVDEVDDEGVITETEFEL